MSNVLIDQNKLNEIRKYGAEAYTQECCGVILGSVNNVSNPLYRASKSLLAIS